MRQLTQRQREICEFIDKHQANRGYSPTVREIAAEFNISSPNGVMCHIKALRSKGYLEQIPNRSRTLCLTSYWINGAEVEEVNREAVQQLLTLLKKPSAREEVLSLLDSMMLEWSE